MLRCRGKAAPFAPSQSCTEPEDFYRYSDLDLHNAAAKPRVAAVASSFPTSNEFINKTLGLHVCELGPLYVCSLVRHCTTRQYGAQGTSEHLGSCSFAA